MDEPVMTIWGHRNGEQIKLYEGPPLDAVSSGIGMADMQGEPFYLDDFAPDLRTTSDA